MNSFIIHFVLIFNTFENLFLLQNLMVDFKHAYTQIKELVNDFRAGEKHYLSKEYQEAEVRKDFIDKFWIALGWDVHHDKQKNPFEQEVKVEKGVNVSGAQKR